MLPFIRLGCMEVGDLCRISIHLKMFVFLFAYEKMFNIVLTGQTKITSYMSTGKRPVYDVHVFALREDLIFCIVQESALILKELKEALWIGRSTRSKERT